MSQYNELRGLHHTHCSSSAAKLAWPIFLAECCISFSLFYKLFLLTASWNVTLHSVKYSLGFSAERYITSHFSLWLMCFYFISFLATCGLDHPFLLLPDLWLCSQHIGCHQCTCLSQHNSGLPPPAGKLPDFHKPFGALGRTVQGARLVPYF